MIVMIISVTSFLSFLCVFIVTVINIYISTGSITGSISSSISTCDIGDSNRSIIGIIGGSNSSSDSSCIGNTLLNGACKMSILGLANAIEQIHQKHLFSASAPATNFPVVSEGLKGKR